MAARETHVAALLRWEKLGVVQRHYSEFVTFLEAVMEMLGFSTSEIQHDIAMFLAHGPQYLMVQAQRGQAKTTIAAAFCVWSLIHNPRDRVLILSAGGAQASEISTLVIRIILTMPELECMKPDTTNGDRSSVEHFDVHYSLKGIDKSPSVACVGITSNLQGKRADILLADDVESTKNSTTAVQRAQLLHLTLDFTSICSSGRIIWLGTPQSSESIYNTLPGRGVTVRIWPGRYPNPEQLANYGEHLAPLLRHRLEQNPALAFGGGMLGDQGQPIDPIILDERTLQAKELDQGASYFQLQHMLNTRLVDALRYPLKAEQLVVMQVQQVMPMQIVRGFGGATLRDFRVLSHGFKMQSPHDLSKETARLQGIMVYIDPAGGGVNADETGYAITGFLNGNIFLLDVGGLPGGYSTAVMEELAARILVWKPNVVQIEKNMGYGAFREVFLPILRRVHECSVEDDYVTGQKEKRIIATLEPVINAGRLIVHEGVPIRDAEDCARYEPAKRLTYSLFHQLAKITKDSGSLVHDDRLDAVEGAVRYWQRLLAQDQSRTVEAQRARDLKERLSDPLGHKRYEPPKARGSLFNRYKR